MNIYLKSCLSAVLLAVGLATGALHAQTIDTGAGMVRADPDTTTAPRSRRAPATPAVRAALSADPAAGRASALPGGAPMEAAESGGGSVYSLMPHDVVEIHVFQEDDLLTTARIAQDGTIKFPLIGSIRLSGKTEDTAAQAIGGELAKDYLVNPQVTVKVVEYAQRRYTVLGQVTKPGTYAMPDRDSITLFEAIGNAGGFTRIANLGDIQLKRMVDGKDTLFKLSAKSSANDRRSSAFEIRAGDIITVGESFF